LGIVLSVAHVNHKLRGEESDEDERFVAKLARQHGLDLHVWQAPVDGISEIRSESRRRRVNCATVFFAAGAGRSHRRKIATAHTLDDQAETVLLRIFRGTGIRGLSGIHPRIIFEEQGARSANWCGRCSVSAAALQEFLREQGQSWREDSSNRDIAFLRNRVRHRLLPMITRRIWRGRDRTHVNWRKSRGPKRSIGSIGHPEVRMDGAGQIRGAGSNDETRQAASLPLDSLLALPLAAQRRLVRGWLETNAPDLSISFRLIEEALELAGEPAGRQWRCAVRVESSAWTAGPSAGIRTCQGAKRTADYEYALRAGSGGDSRTGRSHRSRSGGCRPRSRE
jgi:tRNA(Ile)-lysidine synthase